MASPAHLNRDLQTWHSHARTRRSIVILLGMVLLGCYGCGPSTTPPFAEDRIELKYVMDGQTYFVVDDGNAYRERVPDEEWEYFATIYDPEEVRRAYIEEAGVTYRVAPDTQQRFAVRRDIHETFEDLPEGIAGLPNMVDPARRLWGSFTLQSPQAPSVADYVALRADLLSGKSGFRDCVIGPTRKRAHSGNTSLECIAPAKPDHMITCKASLSSPIVYFRNRDDFWFEAYYWVDGSLPMTLVDLECEFTAEHAGIRLRLFDDASLGIELKALNKPQYRQAEETKVAFPKREWVCVKAHYHLSPTEGRMELWQNDQKVLDEQGMTLPFKSAVYNSLEVGISAHHHGSQASILFLDDLRVSDRDFASLPSN